MDPCVSETFTLPDRWPDPLEEWCLADTTLDFEEWLTERFVAEREEKQQQLEREEIARASSVRLAELAADRERMEAETARAAAIEAEQRFRRWLLNASDIARELAERPDEWFDYSAGTWKAVGAGDTPATTDDFIARVIGWDPRDTEGATAFYRREYAKNYGERGAVYGSMIGNVAISGAVPASAQSVAGAGAALIPGIGTTAGYSIGAIAAMQLMKNRR